MEIGAQLYTVRDLCTNLEDFAQTLKQIADIGYRTVQVSGVCAYEPEWLRDQLKQNGLRCVLTHTPADRIAGETEKVCAEHDVFGCEYVGLGWYGFNDDMPYDHFVKTFGPAAKALRTKGKYFTYHNHAHEFRKMDGKLILERICEDIPAEDMGVTLDTYWVQVGGADPAQWLEKLAGRIPCIHLKDCAFGQKMASIGEGNINFDRVFEKAEAGGTKYMLVEQDDCNGENPLECLRRSYEYLTACGFH